MLQVLVLLDDEVACLLLALLLLARSVFEAFILLFLHATVYLLNFGNLNRVPEIVMGWFDGRSLAW